MSMHLSPPFSKTNPTAAQRRPGQFRASEFKPWWEQNRQRHTSSCEPGMCMKTQQLRERTGIQIAATKNLDVENKGVTSSISRLDKIGGLHRKMKVYPGMLMKTKGVKNRPQEYPGMLMKIKLVIGTIRECS